MQAIYNYICHISVDPDYYQRRFENDLPGENEGLDRSPWIEQAKRISLIALPFLSLYNPIGKAITLGMGSIRTFTHLSAAIKAGSNKQALACFVEIGKTTQAVVALAASIFNHRIGLMITTATDIGTSLVHATELFRHKKYKEAVLEILQAASSMLYLAIMLRGSLEIQLASILLQGAISLCQAAGEFKQKKMARICNQTVHGMHTLSSSKAMYPSYSNQKFIRSRRKVF